MFRSFYELSLRSFMGRKSLKDVMEDDHSFAKLAAEESMSLKDGLVNGALEFLRQLVGKNPRGSRLSEREKFNLRTRVEKMRTVYNSLADVLSMHERHMTEARGYIETGYAMIAGNGDALRENVLKAVGKEMYSLVEADLWWDKKIGPKYKYLLNQRKSTIREIDFLIDNFATLSDLIRDDFLVELERETDEMLKSLTPMQSAMIKQIDSM